MRMSDLETRLAEARNQEEAAGRRSRLPRLRRLMAGRGMALALCLVVFLSGCAGAPLGPPFSMASPPPENRARIYLFRSDERPSPSTVHVTIDGREIGRFRNGEYETLELSAGSHHLRAGVHSVALIAWGWNEQRIRFDPGETVFVQLSVRLTERAQPAAAGLEIAGRGSGAASENVYLEIQPESEALSLLDAMTRLVP